PAVASVRDVSVEIGDRRRGHSWRYEQVARVCSQRIHIVDGTAVGRDVPGVEHVALVIPPHANVQQQSLDRCPVVLHIHTGLVVMRLHERVASTEPELERSGEVIRLVSVAGVRRLRVVELRYFIVTLVDVVIVVVIVRRGRITDVVAEIPDVRLMAVTEAELGGLLVADIVRELAEEKVFTERRYEAAVVLTEIDRIQSGKSGRKRPDVHRICPVLIIPLVRPEKVNPVLDDRTTDAE